MKGKTRGHIRKEEQQRSDEQPLSAQSAEHPGFEPGMTMRSVKLAKGAVRLSEFYGFGIGPPSGHEETPQPPAAIGLRYESMNEADADHGVSTICGILMDANLWILSPARRERLISDIKGAASYQVWLTNGYDQLRQEAEEGGADEGICDAVIVGVWAECFADPLRARLERLRGRDGADSRKVLNLTWMRHVDPDHATAA